MKPTSILFLFAICTFSIIGCNNQTPSKPAEEPATNNSPTPSIFDIHWKLIEVNGQVVNNVGDSTRHAHLILKSTGDRVNGNGGCNSYSGLYTLGERNQISFSNIASTKMACDNMESEGLFFNALQMADNYTVLNDTLSLNKAKMAPLARLVASH